MAKLNLSQAAKATGKNRTTIWRHVKSGKLSSERDIDGMPFIDTSELLRVYGELKSIATPKDTSVQHRATPSYEDLIAVIESLKKEQSEMREQLTALNNRLTYNSNPPPQKQQKPEDDPEWPAEIKSLSDISLRSEIRKKY